LIDKAIAFATEAHKGQFRKGTTRPFILHPLEVGKIVASMTEDKEVICAAILHDTIEDCEGITEQMICREFSPRVADLVLQESEDKSKTWMERKSATIEHLKVAPKEIQMIGLADKLSNMRDIARDYPECGEELWKRFRMKDKHIIGWYYKSVRDSLEASMKDTAAYREYSALIEKNS
jgi:myo-inositol-1(or 4)-monophosphatase